jgi:hypothetical protein
VGDEQQGVEEASKLVDGQRDQACGRWAVLRSIAVATAGKAWASMARVV